MSAQYDYLVRHGWTRIYYRKVGCVRIARWVNKAGTYEGSQDQAILIQRMVNKQAKAQRGSAAPAGQE